MLIEDTDQYMSLAQRSSAAQIVMKTKDNDPLQSSSNHKPKKDNPVNFYINIDKLKNLKISSRDIPKINPNNHSSIKSQSLQSNNRKSLMLRQYGK